MASSDDTNGPQNPADKAWATRRAEDPDAGTKAANKAVMTVRERYGSDAYERMGKKAAATKKWKPYLEEVHRYVESGRLDSEEVDYKLRLGDALERARQAVLAGRDDWRDIVKAGTQGKHHPMAWRNAGKLRQWIDDDPDAALNALRSLWTEDDRSTSERIRSFSALYPWESKGGEVPPEGVRHPKYGTNGRGTRLRTISVLLMALDPSTYPPFMRSVFDSAYQRLGVEVLSGETAEEIQYEHALGFLDELIRRTTQHGLTRPSTRLEAQSVVWATRGPGESEEEQIAASIAARIRSRKSGSRLAAAAHGLDRQAELHILLSILGDAYMQRAADHQSLSGAFGKAARRVESGSWSDDQIVAVVVDGILAEKAGWRYGAGRAKSTPKPPPSKETAQPPLDLGKLAHELLYQEEELRTIEKLLDDKRQVIFQGPPGTGKTYAARQLARFLAGSNDRVTLVQFHPSYAYEDFVQGYRPTLQGRQAGFTLRGGPLLTAATAARDEPDAPHFLIIDEINRGNLAKVFGELYFLLEYRNERTTLQYASAEDEPFSLPENLYIIGTMNTADRSIALVDLALRRRFHFVEFHPDKAPVEGLLGRWLAKNAPPAMAWVADVMRRANSKLDDRHAAIGPSYFMKEDLDEEKVRLIWEHNVLPYVEEHLYGETHRLAEFDLDKLRHQTESGEADASSHSVEAPGELDGAGRDEEADDAES